MLETKVFGCCFGGLSRLNISLAHFYVNATDGNKTRTVLHFVVFSISDELPTTSWDRYTNRKPFSNVMFERHSLQFKIASKYRNEGKRYRARKQLSKCLFSQAINFVSSPSSAYFGPKLIRIFLIHLIDENMKANYRIRLWIHVETNCLRFKTLCDEYWNLPVQTNPIRRKSTAMQTKC